jgi:hypothetical protein
MRHKTRTVFIVVALPREMETFEMMEGVEIKGKSIFGIYTYKHSIMGTLGWLHKYENKNFGTLTTDNRGAIL